MPLSGFSLNAATAVGPGAEIMFDEPRLVVAQVTFVSTGPTSSWNVAIEGTLDGVNWSIFRQTGSPYPGSYLSSNPGDPPVMGVRANITANSGGAVISAFLSATEF